MRGVRRAILVLAQIVVGLFFVFSGFVKAIDPMGSAFKIGEYLASFQINLPQSIHVLGSVVLCCFEFFVGAMVLAGSYRRITTRVVFALMCFMTTLTLYIAIFNPVKDCGCFGDAFSISNWATFGKNVGLLFVSLFLMFYPLDMLRVFTRVGRWIPSALALGGVVCFALMNVVYLPMVDFRPFKVGANITQLVRTPEGSPQDEMEILFVYEKGGERKSFDMNNLPDSTWVFVDREEKLIREGAKPVVQDFHIFNYDGEELTDSILQLAQSGFQGNDRGLILLLTPYWQQANDERMDLLGEIYDRASERGIAFYGISGSTEKDAEEWRYRTGADYPLLLMDATTIKTIIRAQPGLVFFRKGQITSKISDADLPTMDQVDPFLDVHLGKVLSYQRLPWLRVIPLILWFILIIGGYIVQAFRHTATARRRRNSRRRGQMENQIL